MAIQQKLHARLVQKLILTPSLQQAIKLLPMTTIELAELLNQEMVENPMLEEVPAEDPVQEATPAEQAEEQKKDDGKDDAWDDQDYEYFFGEYLDDGYRPRQPQEVKELPPIENTLSSKGSLSDHLMWQLNLQQSEQDVRDIGAGDHRQPRRGRLSRGVRQRDRHAWRVGCHRRRTRARVRAVVRSGGRRRARPPGVPAAFRFATSGSPARRSRCSSAITCGCCRTTGFRNWPRRSASSRRKSKQHIEVIKRLDPKPGSRYSPADSQYVIPDVYVIKTDDGYRAVLNEDGLPQLRISPVYRRLLDKGGEVSDETRAYVKDKFRAALWLLKSVDQRQKTIVKVATSLINFQRAFLDQGIEHLRPLVLRDVANDIGMHESTVSRVVNNKYMHTPQGVYELKFFFHSGISSSYGENVSSVTIKERIRKIVGAEDQKRPLSDSKIMNILQKEGLVLARRTIAKYREELRIPTSNQRKVVY